MEGITIDPEILWNIILTVVILPAGFLLRSLLAEQKRLYILVNKTREEIAREYVTREQLEKDLEKKQELLKIILMMKWQITYQLVKVVVALDLV